MTSTPQYQTGKQLVLLLLLVFTARDPSVSCTVPAGILAAENWMQFSYVSYYHGWPWFGQWAVEAFWLAGFGFAFAFGFGFVVGTKMSCVVSCAELDGCDVYVYVYVYMYVCMYMCM